MTTRKTFSAAAIVAVLSCSAAHAQVLGGAVGGAVNGAVGGGLRDTSVLSNGNAAGSFGGELDTGSMIHRTRGAADQTTRRARNVGANVRNRAESTVATAHDTSANAASSAAATASQQEQKKLDLAPKLDSTPKLDSAPKLDSVTGNASHSASGNASASRRSLAADVAADSSAAASVDSKKKETQE